MGAPEQPESVESRLISPSILSRVVEQAHARKASHQTCRGQHGSASLLFDKFAGSLPPGSSPGRLTDPWSGSGSTVAPALVEVLCQYDAQLQSSDSHGRVGGSVRPQHLSTALGPVATLFCWYSKDRLSRPALSKAQQSSPTSHPQDLRRPALPDAAPGLTLQEVTTIFEDFDVVPQLIPRNDVRAAFRLAACSASAGACGLEPGNLRTHVLQYAAFCDLLVRVAAAAFSRRPAGAPPQPADCVRALLHHLSLDSHNPRQLLDKLASFERLAGDRGPKRLALRWDYASCQSGLHSTTVDGGSVWVAHRRHLRLVVVNRSSHQVSVQVAVSGMPFVTCGFLDQPLAPGVPCVIDFQATFEQAGEWLGTVVVSVLSLALDKEETHTLPIYARASVCHSAMRPEASSYVDALFQHFDLGQDGGLNKAELAALVTSCNPAVSFADEQLAAIVSEVFTQYAGDVEGEVGLSRAGVLKVYSDGVADAQQDCAAVGLALPPGGGNMVLEVGALEGLDSAPSEARGSARVLMAQAVQGMGQEGWAQHVAALQSRAVAELSPPEAYEAHMELGYMLATRRCYEAALESFEQAASLSPDPRAFFRMGNALFALRRFADARYAFTQALQAAHTACDAPLLPKIRVNLGIALEADGLLLSASEQYREACRLNPQHHRAFKLLGSARFALGDLPGAREALEQALQLKPDYADALSDLGCTLCNLGRIPEALQAFKGAVAINKQHLEALFNQGNLHRQCRDYDEAVACYDAVLVIDSSHWRSLLNKAVVLIMMDRQKDAQAALAAAQKLSGLPLGGNIKQLSRLAKEHDSADLSQLMSRLGESRPATSTAAKRTQGWRGLLRPNSRSASGQPAERVDVQLLEHLVALTGVATSDVTQEVLRSASQNEGQEVKLNTRVELEVVLRRILASLPPHAFQEVTRIEGFVLERCND
ncbi:hypothetical protein WJX72_010306 [[Myrmecia] bisecta]|uniref:EF-hand domain-containing protein n=1 Tax=[Myrmecia] bisecta TaxID=41462 RepID=A0AAW1QG35_9CHLO